MVGEQEYSENEREEEVLHKKKYQHQTITKLRDLPQIGEATEKKLKEGGIGCIEHLAITPLVYLTDVVGLGEIIARKLTLLSRKILNFNFRKSSEIWEFKKELYKLTTGSEELDDLLWGGIEPGKIHEFYGESETGKTQICHQLAVNVQLPYERGGLEGSALYIDTEGTYSPERIIQMASGLKLEYFKVLDNIIVGRVYTSDHQIRIIQEIINIIAQYNIKLVLVDSLTNHFQTEYKEKTETSNYANSLGMHIADLKRICNVYPNVAIVCSNQVFEDSNIFYGNPIKHIGGNIVAHQMQIRIFLQKRKKEQRLARLVKAPNIPERDAYYKINDNGIKDLKAKYEEI